MVKHNRAVATVVRELPSTNAEDWILIRTARGKTTLLKLVVDWLEEVHADPPALIDGHTAIIDDLLALRTLIDGLQVVGEWTLVGGDFGHLFIVETSGLHITVHLRPDE